MIKSLNMDEEESENSERKMRLPSTNSPIASPKGHPVCRKPADIDSRFTPAEMHVVNEAISISEQLEMSDEVANKKLSIPSISAQLERSDHVNMEYEHDDNGNVSSDVIREELQRDNDLSHDNGKVFVRMIPEEPACQSDISDDDENVEDNENVSMSIAEQESQSQNDQHHDNGGKDFVRMIPEESECQNDLSDDNDNVSIKMAKQKMFVRMIPEKRQSQNVLSHDNGKKAFVRTIPEEADCESDIGDNENVSISMAKQKSQSQNDLSHDNGKKIFVRMIPEEPECHSDISDDNENVSIRMPGQEPEDGSDPIDEEKLPSSNGPLSLEDMYTYMYSKLDSLSKEDAAIQGMLQLQHTGLKSYHAHQAYLKSHQRTIGCEKPKISYACKSCGKQFPVKCSLTVHELFHCKKEKSTDCDLR